jgi:hypothetical protein
MDSISPTNPFALGGVVRGKQFAGRTHEVERLRQLARAGERVYVFAPRRYGKTSLLREAFEPEVARGRAILLWCDCLPAVDARDLAARLAREVVRGVKRGKAAQWAKEAGALFKRIRPIVAVRSDGQVRLEVEVGSQADRDDPGLEDALEAVGRLATAKGSPVVVVFDEFQQIATWDRDQHTEAVIRTAIQHQEGVAYAFAGSQRHLLQAMFADRARPLFKLAAPFPVSRLSPAELRPWLEELFAESGLELEDAAAETLLTLGAGQPGATQYLGHFVWEAAGRASTDRINHQTVISGLDTALAVGATTYEMEISRLTGPQRRVLAAVAREPTSSPTAVDYLGRQHLPAKSTVSQALGSLVDKGLIESEGTVYLVGDPLLGEWLRRQ